MNEEDLRKSVFAMASSDSSDGEEEEEAPKPNVQHHILDFLHETRDFSIVDKMRVPVHDRLEKKGASAAFNERCCGLERHDKDEQVRLLKKEQETIVGLLRKFNEELSSVTDVPSFLAAFEEIAVRQMREAMNDEKRTSLLLARGTDLYIMTGMMLGLFRPDEDLREKRKQVKGFEARNFHKKAEDFLLHESIQEVDRQRAEKRKAADDEEAMQRMEEEEERRREDEELNLEAEEDMNRWLETQYYDHFLYQLRTSQGFTHADADKECRAKARADREAHERVREIRSSPPRSEYDPSEALENIHIVDEISVHTPMPCPDAGLSAADIYAAHIRAGGAPACSERVEDVEMEDVSRRDYDQSRGDQARAHRGRRDPRLEKRAAANHNNDARAVQGSRAESSQYIADPYAANGQQRMSRRDHGTARSSHHDNRNEHRERQYYPEIIIDYDDGEMRARREGEARMRAVRSHERSRSRERARTPARQDDSQDGDSPSSYNTRRRSSRSTEREVVPEPEPEPEPNQREPAWNGRVWEAGEEPTEQYKKKLTSREMKQMLAARVEKEKWRMENLAPEEWLSGQKEFSPEYVMLPEHIPGCSPPFDPYEGAVQVDVGRPVAGLKGILKKKHKNAPALLTDVHVDRLQLPPPSEDVKFNFQRVNLPPKLVQLQNSFAAHPRKKVSIAPADSELHTVRCYEMQNACEPTPAVFKELRRGMLCDTRDDGYDQFKLDNPMTWYKDLLLSTKASMDKYQEGETRFFTSRLSTLEYRRPAGSAHYQEPDSKTLKPMNWSYYEGPVAIPVTTDVDCIYTRDTAEMSPSDAKKEQFKEYTVSHRDYRILLAMKDMPDFLIEKHWLPQLRMFVTDAFTPILNRDIGKESPANSGVSHLIFADSLLDRVNTFRFPQAHFIIHQQPLTLSSSYRVLCNDVPFASLLNIEWFIFAYGFDEIVFQGEAPEIVAEIVTQHVLAVMNLRFAAAQLLRNTHRCTITPKFRVFRLPTYDMDPRIASWIARFNAQLNKSMREFEDWTTMCNSQHMMQMMYKIVSWETPAMKKDAEKAGQTDLMRSPTYDKRNPEEFMYNCINGFAIAAYHHCGMRTARLINPRLDKWEFFDKRESARVVGLSEEEHNRYY